MHICFEIMNIVQNKSLYLIAIQLQIENLVW